MLPAVLVGIAAAGALANYISSEKGRRMQTDERNRLEALIDKLQSPNFDTSMIEPPDLRILETYTPEIAPMVYENAPELVTADSQRAIQGKSAQDAALAQFQSMGRGEDPLSDMMIVKALNDAIENSGAQQDAILKNMARQGISPGSSAYGQLQFQTAGQSQKNMFDSALQAAIAGQQRRQQAIGQSAQLGGNILGFETDLEKLNDSTINDLNRRNTEARRGFLTNRANTLNSAQKFNQGERQRIYETTAMNTYGAQQRAQDLRNKQVAANYDTETNKLSFKTGHSRFGDIAGATQDRSNMIQGVTDAALLASVLAGQSSQKTHQSGQQAQQQSREVPVTSDDRLLYSRYGERY